MCFSYYLIHYIFAILVFLDPSLGIFAWAAFLSTIFKFYVTWFYFIENPYQKNDQNNVTNHSYSIIIQFHEDQSNYRELIAMKIDLPMV
jgi:hypothetical protein